MLQKAVYLYLRRVPIVIGALLFFFPLLAIFTSLNALFENLFDFNFYRTFLTAALALITGWSVVLTGRLVLINGQERFGTLPTGVEAGSLSQKGSLWALVLALPTLFVQFVKLSTFAPHPGDTMSLRGIAIVNISAVLLGAFAAYFLAWAGVYLSVFLAPAGTQVSTARSFPVPPFLAGLRRAISRADARGPLDGFWARLGPHIAGARPGLREGLVDDNGFPLSGIWLATSFGIVTLALYELIDWYKLTQLGVSDSYFPAFFFVLWLLLNANWVLSFIAFFLDRWRIPLLIPFTILCVVSTVAPSNDHYYTVKTGATIRSVPPADVLHNRWFNSEDCHVVLAATAGGGIQSAAWTARVLTGLQKASSKLPNRQGCFGRSDFASNLTAVSSVSGGAVGAMFFLNQYVANVKGFNASQAQMEEMIKDAEQPSLDDIAWSLVYHDIPRLYTPFTVNRKLDRGYLLEQLWRSRGDINANLSNWQEGVLEGWRPVTIFNSTFAESGEPLLFSTSDISDPGVPVHRWNFTSKYRNMDIPVVTAVRLAATFPYVSPAARADTAKPEFHVVDGGYYDNYGVASLVRWLYDGVTLRALSANGEPAQITWKEPEKKILVVQILSFPPDAEAKPVGNKSGFFQLYAPLDALIGVRTTSQLLRDQDALESLQKHWPCKVAQATFQFDGNDAPLSWQMNRTQIDEIERQWKKFEEPAEDTIRNRQYNPHDEFLAVSCFLDESQPECRDRKRKKAEPQNDCSH
jgi:hypothetical protein